MRGADKSLIRWLGQIQEPSQVDVNICGREVILNCRNAYLALTSWRRRNSLQGFDLTIWLNGSFLDSTTRSQRVKMDSSWVHQNGSIFKNFSEVCTAAIHSEAVGYPFLAIQPYLGIEAVLNKKVKQLLGQPASAVASPIAEAKLLAIKQAIASGGVAKVPYQMEWNGTLWKKLHIAAYLCGHQEVLVKTVPARGEEWHQGFWRNHLADLRRG